jgi:hypothetical protein
MRKSQSMFNLKVASKKNSASTFSSQEFRSVSTSWLKIILPFVMVQEVSAEGVSNDALWIGIAAGAGFLVCCAACIARRCRRTNGTEYQAAPEDKIDSVEQGMKCFEFCLGP